MCHCNGVSVTHFPYESAEIELYTGHLLIWTHSVFSMNQILIGLCYLFKCVNSWKKLANMIRRINHH